MKKEYDFSKRERGKFYHPKAELNILVDEDQRETLISGQVKLPVPPHHRKELEADPITDRASAVIVAHNHPAGGTSPSREDREVTQQLKSAGETLGIRLLDHIIFDRKGYYSFLEKGEI